MPIEGAKIIINKSLSQQFQVTHYLTMSAIQPSGYRFGSTYVGNMVSFRGMWNVGFISLSKFETILRIQISPTDPKALLMGDIDPSGNLNAQGFYHITEALKFKWAAQVCNSSAL